MSAPPPLDASAPAAPPAAPKSSTGKVLLLVFIVLGSCVLFGRACGDDDKATSTTQSLADSLRAAEAAKTPEQRAADYMEQVDREIESLADGYKVSERKTDTDFMMEMVLFGGWGQIIKKADSLQLSDAERVRVQRLRSAVSSAQQREFPKIRRAWGAAKKQAMWENDIDVAVGGAGSRTIRFTAAMFAANRNIQQTQETIQESLCLFRFKRSEYKWYSDASRYTSYTMDSCPDDGTVGTFEGNRFVPVD